MPTRVRRSFTSNRLRRATWPRLRSSGRRAENGHPMKHISQSYKTGVLRIAEVAEPKARAGTVLVQSVASLLSAGTERTIVELGRKSLLGKARERPDLVAKVIDKARREGP